MSRTILIYGHSGVGKTTSCRNLDPKSTFIIDCDGKGLSWRGWRKSFSTELHNYYRTDDLDKSSQFNVPKILRTVATNPKFSHIKTIVVDGISTLMVVDVARRSEEKGFDKWRDLAYSILEIIRSSNHFRDDLTIVFIGHVDTSDATARVKTSGQKLTQIVLESFFTTVLYAKSDGDNYFFETYSNNSTAKSPMGALPPTVDNDIQAVIDALIDYEEG